MLGILVQGFLLQASLIFALGAQNIFVLNSGLRRQRHLLVALVCSVCDTILIFVGVLGVATVFLQISMLKIGLGFVGVAFLAFYGFLKIKEAKDGPHLTQTSQQVVTSKQAILTSLGFSLLNPHVYLDTVVLIGGYSSQFERPLQRFYFGVGASSFSVFWFFGLVTLASYGNQILSHSKIMRIVSLISGLILIVLAIKLGRDVWIWM